MSFLITKIIKEVLGQITEIDTDIKMQAYNPNPIFKDFDEELVKDIEETKKSINTIKDSIHYTKK